MKKQVIKKAAPKKSTKKTSASIQYWALAKLGKKQGWLYLVFDEPVTPAELKAFNNYYLTIRLKATAIKISKDIYDYWINEEIHNSLDMENMSDEPFGFLPGADDDIYEEILELNPELKIKVRK